MSQTLIKPVENEDFWEAPSSPPELPGSAYQIWPLGSSAGKFERAELAEGEGGGPPP